jgi:hypothetical protein
MACEVCASWKKLKSPERKITISNTMARARLYTLDGGVPKGFQERNTKKADTHRRGANPLKKLSTNFSHRGMGGTFSSSLGPFSFRSLAACSSLRPKVESEFKVFTKSSDEIA